MQSPELPHLLEDGPPDLALALLKLYHSHWTPVVFSELCRLQLFHREGDLFQRFIGLQTAESARRVDWINLRLGAHTSMTGLCEYTT